MNPDDDVCLCFHVSLRKIGHFIRRTQPQVPSQISECLGAGTGCRWCVPFLEKLHAQWQRGEPIDLPVSPAEYAAKRSAYRRSGRRDEPERPDEQATR
jgi:bacterioferritin-associated ferredoxin